MSSEDFNNNATSTALNHLSRKLGAQSVLFSQAVAARLNIHSTDIECLDLLVVNGPLSAGTLAELTGLTTGAITGIIDRLEARNYVERQADPTDRRKVIVAPCLELVEREFGPMYQSLGEAMADFYSRYSEDELQFLLEYSRKVDEILTAETVKLRSLS